MFDTTNRTADRDAQRPATRLTRLLTPQSGRITFIPRTGDVWHRLDRILTLDDEGYDEQVVRECIAIDGPRVVRRIVEVSALGRTSNAPALRSLALSASCGNAATREMAYEAVPEVARSVAEYFVFVGDKLTADL